MTEHEHRWTKLETSIHSPDPANPRFFKHKHTRCKGRYQCDGCGEVRLVWENTYNKETWTVTGEDTND